MGKIAFLKTFLAAGGILWVGVASALAIGQPDPAKLDPSGVVTPAPIKPGLVTAGKPAAPPDLLEGLTLSDDQKAKIDQIRADTKTRMANAANDPKLDPDTAIAMRRGYQRLENGRILEVLTLEQQQQVRKRIAAWRTTQGKPQYPLRPAPAQAARAQ